MSIDVGLKVLVADDMRTARAITIKILKEIGLTDFTEAIDGREALGKYTQALKEEKPFDLIISDHNMPGLSGMKLLIQIRDQEKEVGRDSIPFVLLTAETDKSDFNEEYLNSPKTGFLNKPYNAQSLEQTIKTTL